VFFDLSHLRFFAVACVKPDAPRIQNTPCSAA
jgi:hypothetical protein